MGAVTVQVLVSFFVSVPVFMIAFGSVWPSYALRILESEQSPLPYRITQSDGSIIGSVAMLGSLASVTIVGYINEKIGRKRSAILSGLCLALSWSIIATAKTVTLIVIGRFLSGVGGGLNLVTALIIIGEISHSSLKGLLLPVITFMYSIGTLVSYIEGWFCSYDVINYSSLTLLVVYVVLATFLKETPSYLLRQGKDKEALSSLKFYRGASTVTQEILDELFYIRSQQEPSDTNNSGLTGAEIETENLNQEKCMEQNRNIPEQSSWQIIKSSKGTQRELVILSVNMVLAVFMGMIGVQTYAGQMFKRAAPDISPDLCSVILAIVISITSAVTIFVTDMFPRRILMVFSCVMSAVCMALLASMLRWSWAPELAIPIAIVFYCVFYTIGAINVPFVQVPECLLPQVQSFGSTFVMANMFLANFIVLYLFEPTVNLLGLEGLFVLFAVISLVTAIVAYLFMRETRKVPLEIVHSMFEHSYFYRNK